MNVERYICDEKGLSRALVDRDFLHSRFLGLTPVSKRTPEERLVSGFFFIRLPRPMTYSLERQIAS